MTLNAESIAIPASHHESTALVIGNDEGTIHWIQGHGLHRIRVWRRIIAECGLNDMVLPLAGMRTRQVWMVRDDSHVDGDSVKSWEEERRWVQVPDTHPGGKEPWTRVEWVRWRGY